MNRLGQAALLASLTGTADGSTQGLFLGVPGSLTALVRNKWVYTGAGGGTFEDLYGYSLNDSYAAFYSNLSGASDGAISGIFLTTQGGPGNQWAVARTGQSAPGSGGGQFNYLHGLPVINADSRVLFYAGLTGNSEGRTGGLFVGDGWSTPTPLVRQGDAAPGWGGGTINVIGNQAGGFNDSGQAAFYAGLANTSDGSNLGVFLAEQAGLKEIARSGQAAPGLGGGRFQQFMSTPAVGPAGQVVFDAVLENTVQGLSGDYGLFLADDTELLAVVREGQPLADSTVAGIGWVGGLDTGGRAAINYLGQVAYQAVLNNGKRGAFLFTPELHFRAWGGEWSDDSNWTVGLRPTHVHNVLIDGPGGNMVYGPAGHTAVKSLTVGSALPGNQTNILRLNSGAVLTVNEDVTVKESGQLELLAGKLTAAYLTNHGQVYQLGADLDAAVYNTGLFHYQAGSLPSGFENHGLFEVSGPLAVPSDFFNYQEIRVNVTGAFVNNAAAFDNTAIVTLAGGQFGGSLPVTNYGQISGYGTLTGTAGFTNYGLITQSGGNLGVNNAGTNANLGTINLAAGLVFHVSPAGLNNSGTINLNGARIESGGALLNDVGATISGYGMLAPALFLNSGGTLRAQGGTLNVTPAFTNIGLISVQGGASLIGGAISNSGRIQGDGSISNDITNSGRIQPIGTLVLGGSLSNSATGLITASAGNSLLLTGPFGANAGTVNLTGGSFDTNGNPITNTGQVSGFGTFATGGLTNDGSVTFTGGVTTVQGNLTNSVGKQVRVAYNPAIFTGTVNNYGTFKNQQTTITFAGTYNEFGTFLLDPSDTYFADVDVHGGGRITGGPLDRVFVLGQMTNAGQFTLAGELNAGDVTTSGQFAQSGPTTIRPASTFASSGTTAISGTQSWGAGAQLQVNGGKTTLSTDAGGPGGVRTLSVQVNAGQADFDASQHLAALSVNGTATAALAGSGGSGGKTLYTDGLVIADSGGTYTAYLDLADNALQLHYTGASPVATIGTMVASGYAFAAWNGPGINSSAAAVTGYALGYADGAEGVVVGLAADEVLVKYVLPGDVTMDGRVEGSDVDYLLGYYSTPSGAGWTQADITYDGKVDGADVDLFLGYYGASGPISAGGDTAGKPASVPVPEPATLCLLALGGCLLGRGAGQNVHRRRARL